MTTITRPPEVEGPLAEEARRLGTTPELLAIGYLRDRFVPSSPIADTWKDATLYDFLSGYIGTIDGTTEALSEERGRRFAEGLVENHKRGHL